MTDWQHLEIRGNKTIEVEDSVFGYEIVIRSSQANMSTTSRVKVYPIKVAKDGNEYKFYQIPAAKASFSIINNNQISVRYLEGEIRDVKSLTEEELNDVELQLARHTKIFEEKIHDDYLPEILNLIP